MTKHENLAKKITQGSQWSLIMFVFLGFLLPSLACGGNSDELEVARLESTRTSIEATSQIIELTRVSAEMTVESQSSETISPPTIQGSEPSNPSPTQPIDSESEIEDPGVVAPPIPTPPPTPEGILFFEDFSNNNNGWDLSSSTGGVTRLSQNQLLVTVNKNSSVWIIIPELEVENEFYVEAQMTYLEGQLCCSWIGWGVGNSNGNNHKFLASTNSYAYYDNSVRLFNTQDSTLFSHNTPVVIGLEFINGNAILYVNGEQKDIFPIQPYGKNIGIFLWNTNTYYGERKNTIAIDNVVVRELR